MLFKVVNQFGSQPGEKSTGYFEGSGLYHIQEFCSLDDMLNDSVFSPVTAEDWENCVCEDFKVDMITSLQYARKVQEQHPGSQIFGLIIDPQPGDIAGLPGLLGYDIIDNYCGNSLVTNCGGFPEIFSAEEISKVGLLDDYERACRIRDELRKRYPEDPHAGACEVWAVFRGSDLIKAGF